MMHQVKAAARSSGLPFACPPIDLVELPRLKLAFNARLDHEGVLRLYSVDHVDLYITNERNDMTKKMLAGIPHSLLLSNVRGETQVRALTSTLKLRTPFSAFDIQFPSLSPVVLHSYSITCDYNQFAAFHNDASHSISFCRCWSP